MFKTDFSIKTQNCRILTTEKYMILGPWIWIWDPLKVTDLNPNPDPHVQKIMDPDPRL